MFFPYFNSKASRAGSGINAPLDDTGATALHKAIEEGRHPDIDRLLRAGADANQVDDSGATPLFTAVCKRDIAAAEKLLRANAKAAHLDDAGLGALERAFAANIDPLTIESFTALGLPLRKEDGTSSVLHSAVAAGRSDLLPYLVEAGAAIDAKDGAGKTALHLACEKRDHQAMALLLKLGADAQARDAALKTPLFMAAESGDMVAADILLAQKGVANDIDRHRGMDNGWSPLLAAVAGGYVGMVKALAALGADVNLRDNENRHSLFLAVENASPDMVRTVIALGADVSKIQRSSFNDRHIMHVIPDEKFAEIAVLLHGAGVDINAQDGSGQTALHMACDANDPKRVKALLDLGADPSRPNEFGKRPLDCVMEHYFYIHEDQFDIVSRLLARGADPNLAPDARVKISPLAAAARSGHVPTLQILLDYKAKVDEAERPDAHHGPEAQTPFMIACAFGRLEAAQLLYREGAYALKRDRMQQMALHLAAARGEKDVVAWLLTLPGYTADLRDGAGKTALHHAVGAGNHDIVTLLLEKGADMQLPDNHGYQPLHLAAREGYEQVVMALLAKAGQDMDIDGHTAGGESALHLAARKGQNDIVGQLLAYGADPAKPAGNGHTPLTYAIFGDHAPTTEKLLHALQRRKVDINALRDKSGATPLHYAVARADKTLAALFVAAGMDINAASHDGNTPLHMAAMAGRVDTVQYLAGEKGALICANDKGQTPLDLARARKHTGVVLKLEALAQAPTQASARIMRRPPF